MTTEVFREVGIEVTFFAMPLWAFGIDWKTFATAHCSWLLMPTWSAGKGSGSASSRRVVIGSVLIISSRSGLAARWIDHDGVFTEQARCVLFAHTAMFPRMIKVVAPGSTAPSAPA